MTTYELLQSRLSSEELSHLQQIVPEVKPPHPYGTKMYWFWKRNEVMLDFIQMSFLLLVAMLFLNLLIPTINHMDEGGEYAWSWLVSQWPQFVVIWLCCGYFLFYYFKVVDCHAVSSWNSPCIEEIHSGVLQHYQQWLHRLQLDLVGFGSEYASYKEIAEGELRATLLYVFSQRVRDLTRYVYWLHWDQTTSPLNTPQEKVAKLVRDMRVLREIESRLPAVKLVSRRQEDRDQIEALVTEEIKGHEPLFQELLGKWEAATVYSRKEQLSSAG